MFILIAVIIFILAISGVSSYFIAAALRRRLARSANKYAVTFSVLTFLGSFVLICAAIAFVILYNLPFER